MTKLTFNFYWLQNLINDQSFTFSFKFNRLEIQNLYLCGSYISHNYLMLRKPKNEQSLKEISWQCGVLCNWWEDVEEWKQTNKQTTLFLSKKFTDSIPENNFGSQDRVIRSWLKGYKIWNQWRKLEDRIVDPTSPFWRRSALGFFWREWCWMKLQYFGHLMRRVDSLEKTLMLGGIGGKRRRGWQRLRWLDGIIDSMDMSLRLTDVGNQFMNIKGEIW